MSASVFSPFTTHSTFDIRFLLTLLDVGSKRHARRGNCWGCCLPKRVRSFLRPCLTRRCRHGNRHLLGQRQIDSRETQRQNPRQHRGMTVFNTLYLVSSLLALSSPSSLLCLFLPLHIPSLSLLAASSFTPLPPCHVTLGST